MRAYERFMNYVKVHTASSDESSSTPTTACQFDLCRMLAEEMSAMGMKDVYADENAYVYGKIPASAGCEDKNRIGFIAHLDTVPDFSGENVKPRIVENYDGGEIVLGDSGRVLSPEQFPHLEGLKGHNIIVTDGTTVLGADDKAGIAEILTACERIINENLPHGEISVCFTPDEEVGHGAACLDIERLGADFAYTVDGGDVNEFNYETFNASGAKVEFNGFNIHPGDAKDKMINASLVAMEFNSMLPSADIPSRTEGYEGFFHLCDMKGGIDKAELSYLIRDHIKDSFKCREKTMLHIEKILNEKYGEGTVKVDIIPQYNNMEEMVSQRREIIDLALSAISKAGYEPVIVPVRGGTDGAQLSYRGLLCPNLGTGGHCFHGPYEHISVEAMDVAVDIILNIISGNLN